MKTETPNTQNLSKSPAQEPTRPPTLSIRSKVKAGRVSVNHNETRR